MQAQPPKPRDRRVRTPTVLQMEAVECGAAALAMVLGYYKRWVPPEELRVECGVSRDGSKASNVIKAARKYGLNAKGLKRDPAQLRSLTLPFIVFWNFNHFVVVDGWRNKRVYLNDPSSGPRWVSEEEFDQSFTGVVLAFERGPEFKPGGTSPSIVNALVSRFRGAETALAFVVLAGLALVIPGFIVPVFTKVFIDEFLVRHMESWVRPLLLGMGITAIIRATLTWLQQYYLMRFRTSLALATGSRFFWHVLRLPVVFYSQRSPGEIGGRVAINDKVAGLLSGELANAFLSVVMVVFYAALMLFYDLVLTLVGVSIAVLNIIFLRAVARTRVDANRRLVADGGKLLGASMTGLRLIETLKASGIESDFFAKWAGYQTKVMNGQQNMGFMNVLLQAVPSFLAGLNGVLILGLGGLRVMDGYMTIGMLVAFQSLMQSFITPVNDLVSLGGKIQELHGAMNRLDDVQKYATDPQADTPAQQLSSSAENIVLNRAKLQGYLELRNITFGYSRLEPPLMRDFSLKLKPGSRVALVGPSGCGKSTVSKLVMGLYEPWEGEILFDGVPRAQTPRAVLNNTATMVDQDIALFEGSIRDNLTMWDHTIPEATAVQAAKDAEIHR